MRVKLSPKFQEALAAEVKRLMETRRTSELKFGAGGTVGVFTRRLDRKKGQMIASWSQLDDELEQLLRSYKAVRKQAAGRADKLRLDSIISELGTGQKHLNAAGRNFQNA